MIHATATSVFYAPQAVVTYDSIVELSRTATKEQVVEYFAQQRAQDASPVIKGKQHDHSRPTSKL